MNKKELRSEFIKRRDGISPDARREKARKASRKIIESDEYKNAENIYAFMSFGSEIDTAIIIRDALERKKRLLLPKINKGVMTFKAVDDLLELTPGPYNIMEPDYNLPDEETDGFMLVPGVVYSADFYRVGYGKGYYDSFLNKAKGKGLKIFKAGFAFEEQVIDEVPTESHDERIDIIYTDMSIRRRQGHGG